MSRRSRSERKHQKAGTTAGSYHRAKTDENAYANGDKNQRPVGRKVGERTWKTSVLGNYHPDKRLDARQYKVEYPTHMHLRNDCPIIILHV